MLESKRRSACIAVGLMVLCAGRVQAEAPRANDAAYVALKLMLGIGGDLSTSNLEIGAIGAGAGINVSGSDDLRPSFGAGAAYMHPLHRYFALGGQLAAHSWQNRAADNAGLKRSTLLDLSIVPQGRLPLSDTIELYLSVPLGVTLDFWNGPRAYVIGLEVDASDTAVGLNFALMLGARFALSRSFGLFVEGGYSLHSFTHGLRVRAANVLSAEAKVNLTLEQFALNAGIFF